MPRKQKKPIEERTAEDFFPVDENDLKYAIEKKYKSSDLEEKSEKSVNKNKKSKKSKTTKKEFKIPKITLKSNGYELIITEKPQAALKISSALGKFMKKNFNGISYYEVSRNNKKIIVACAVGHLFTLKQVKSEEIPVFNIKWTPNFIVRKRDFTKKYYDVLLKLAKNAGSLTVATDYDIEGEVIGLNIVRFICNQPDASRMKFSTLTPSELNESYENKFPTLNWGQAIAGETRHYLDWFYGINLSRALMDAIKTTGSFKIMSIGRVQGPALNLIVKKEKEIQEFKPRDYWQIFIKVKNSHPLELRYNKDIFDGNELKKFENLKGKKANAETRKVTQNLYPNPPFDLTSLQTEAYKLYGITPLRTLQISQNLYLSGLISYPRTSSQKLPPSINYKEILKKLAKKYKIENLITREKPVEGKKSDPAHPAIYPTGQDDDSVFSKLSKEEKKIYDLIVKKFLSLFCDNAIIENKIIKVKADNFIFLAKGSFIKKKGWLEVYPSKIVEKELFDLEGEVEITNVRVEQKQTQPPKRYSPATIVAELEKRNLGTKATRAGIIETLYSREYIRNKSIEATPLGISLIETLKKYSPIIIDEALTRYFEKQIDSISQSKKNFEDKKEKIIEKAKETIRAIAKQFNEKKGNIGKELVNANVKLREQQREENKLNLCPVCEKGHLTIIYSKKNRRYFVACDAYPKCKTTFSLPPNGLIKKANKNCEKCGFPKLLLIKKGRKPWEFCFNEKNHDDFKG